MNGEDEEEIEIRLGEEEEEEGEGVDDYDGDDYVQAGCDFLIHWP